jgi:hypothetical protein
LTDFILAKKLILSQGVLIVTYGKGVEGGKQSKELTFMSPFAGISGLGF